jgi:hypothetical protein
MLFALLAMLAAPVPAQPSAIPDTYSFVAMHAMFGPAMTVKVNRNGSKEVIEKTSVANPSQFHDRVLYDFAAHRIYTTDLISNICSTQAYGSDHAPMFDPIGSSQEMIRDMAKNPPPVVGRENVNGIATKVLEMPIEGGQGKSKVWLDEKHNFVVKLAIGMGKAAALTTAIELRQLSYAPSPAAMFVAPRGCKEIGGMSTAEGGHAEVSMDVKASGTAELGQAGARAPEARPAARQAPPAAPAGNVVSVRYRLEPASYSGRCPAPVKLIGEITTDGPGKVWYAFLAGAVKANGPREGTVEFTAAGTRTVTLGGTIPFTPQVPDTRMLAAMEDAQGKHGPETVPSEDVPYNVTCKP